MFLTLLAFFCSIIYIMLNGKFKHYKDYSVFVVKKTHVRFCNVLKNKLSLAI